MELVEGVATVDDVEAFLARLDAAADAHGVTVQAFDARYVVGRDHLARAVDRADRAIARDENVARERAVEILLYAAGRRQIDRALEMGVDEGEWPVVVFVDDPDAGGDRVAGAAESTATREAAAAVRESLDPAETLGAYDPDLVCEFFGVTDAERVAATADLPALVGERVALLDVEK